MAAYTNDLAKPQGVDATSAGTVAAVAVAAATTAPLCDLSDSQLDITSDTADTHKVENITYDLDDPYLINKLCYTAPNISFAGPITCRFFAIPLTTVYAPQNLEQYGQVVLESREKLLMRIPARNLPFLGCVRQIWVSRYLELGTECRITFDAPRADVEMTSTIIIQRVDAKAEMSGVGMGDGGDGTQEAGALDPSSVARESRGGGGGVDAPREGIPGFETQRRRASSLPSPTILEALGKSPRPTA